jgi:hypothetical protein
MKTLALVLVLISFSSASIFAGGNSRLDSVVFTSSNLPLIIIDTHGQSIHNSYRIVADIGIINNSGGQRNYLNDPFTDYDGKISIEIRGSSSTMFDKKPYGFETQDDSGANNNVSLYQCRQIMIGFFMLLILINLCCEMNCRFILPAN